MRRVLIVTSSYAPAITADAHRARTLAWHLPDCGWEVVILAPGQRLQRRDAIDPESDYFFNPSVPAHLVDGPGSALSKLLKIRGIGWRAFWPLYQAGLEILREKRFDLVYLSTTQFNLFCLGGLWKRKTGVPYVLDFHDPWVRSSVRYVTTKHRFKFRVTLWLSKFLERYAVERAAGVVAVSPVYLDQLRQRYPDARALKAGRQEVIPFSALSHDLQIDGPKVEHSDLRIVYVGAGGTIMAKSFQRIVSLIKEVRQADPHLLEGIRIELAGTDSDWTPAQPRFLKELASEIGVADVIFEEPARISYAAAMRDIVSSDGLLILGVDDPAYMPSKLFIYALTGKPLLVCLHKNSQANQYFDGNRLLGHLIHFNGESSDELDRHEVREFLREVKVRRCFDRRQAISAYVSETAAKRHALFFEHILP